MKALYTFVALAGLTSSSLGLGMLTPQHGPHLLQAVAAYALLRHSVRSGTIKPTPGELMRSLGLQYRLCPYQLVATTDADTQLPPRLHTALICLNKRLHHNSGNLLLYPEGLLYSQPATASQLLYVVQGGHEEIVDRLAEKTTPYHSPNPYFFIDEYLQNLWGQSPQLANTYLSRLIKTGTSALQK